MLPTFGCLRHNLEPTIPICAPTGAKRRRSTLRFVLVWPLDRRRRVVGRLSSPSPPRRRGPLGLRLRVGALATAAALLALAPGSDVRAEPRFAGAFLSFDAGLYPSSVAVGDLNGDGKLDLAAAKRRGGCWGCAALPGHWVGPARLAILFGTVDV